jgi:hypothetical protein
MITNKLVMPAKAGIQKAVLPSCESCDAWTRFWTPAFAGVTVMGEGA